MIFSGFLKCFVENPSNIVHTILPVGIFKVVLRKFIRIIMGYCFKIIMYDISQK